MERLGQQEGRCFWTGAELGDTPIAGDHYIPRSKGGKTEKTNLVVTSTKLNNLRSNTSPKDFSDSLGVDIDHAANLVRLNNNEKCQWN
jgi:5-methylcytosine-specific restriction endonuclease McrA